MLVLKYSNFTFLEYWFREGRATYIQNIEPFWVCDKRSVVVSVVVIVHCHLHEPSRNRFSLLAFYLLAVFSALIVILHYIIVTRNDDRAHLTCIDLIVSFLSSLSYSLCVFVFVFIRSDV